jgi:hypothetical protein
MMTDTLAVVIVITVCGRGPLLDNPALAQGSEATDIAI